jgi:hypothetical protein
LTDVNEVFAYQSTQKPQKITITGTTTTDSFDTFLTTRTGLDYVSFGDEVSGSSTSSTGETTKSASKLTYGAAFLMDEIPEIKSASWNQEIAYDMPSTTSTTTNGVTTNSDGHYTRREDGSYVRSTERRTPGSPAYFEKDTQNADGSGEDANNGTGSLTGGTTTFSAPALVNGQYVITVVHTPLSGSPTTTVVPDWFPGNGPVGQLVSDVRQDLGQVAVPKACGTTAGQTATELRATVKALDIVKGTYNEQVTDAFIVAGEGRVCSHELRYLDTYDNFTTGALQERQRYDILIALTAESLGQMRAKHFVAGFI